MTEEQLQAIEARAEAATPGPWAEWYIGKNNPSGIIVAAEDEESVAQVFNRFDEYFLNWRADAAFIAAARADVPALVAEVERLRAELAAVPVDAIRLAINALASRLYADGLGEHWPYDNIDTWLQSLEMHDLAGAE